MKIQVIQREFESHGSINKSYKICDCKYCCDGIKRLPNINFYFKEANNTDNPIEDDYGYGQDLGVMLEEVTEYHDWGDTFTEEYYYKLNYCPICGEKIEVEIVDNVEVTNEYERLSKERDEVHKKWIKTDSIKKKNELQSKRQELDREIESFYWTDSLPNKEDDENDY